MRRYIIFSVVSLSLLLFAMSASAMAVAFPVVTTDLNTSLVMAGWVLTGYQLVFMTIMPLAGKISEVLGVRRTFMLSALLFTVGSVLCAIAPNIHLLIAFRAIQAIGGGGFMPCSTGIVSDAFPEARQRFIGLLSTVFPFGWIVGPNLGGWMVEYFGWRSTFWLNVPLGILVIVLAGLLLTRDSGKRRDVSFDFIGVGFLFSSIFALILGLTELGNSTSGISGISWQIVGLLFALSIGLMVGFLRYEQRVREPIIDLDLLKEKPFLAANIYNMIYGTGVIGIASMIPLYAVSVFGMSTLESGVILTPRSIGMMVASLVTSIYLKKWGFRRPILVGTLAIALSLLLMALEARGIRVLGTNVSATTLLLIVMALSGIGAGIAAPAANNACIELKLSKVATIAGLRGMFRNIGGATSIAMITVVLHAISDAHQAFYIILIALASLMVISIPSVFFMPSSVSTTAIDARK